MKNMYNNHCFYSSYILSTNSKIDNFSGTKTETLNWTELSFSKIIYINNKNFPVENIQNLAINIEICNLKIIETPIAMKYYEVALLDEALNPVIDSSTNHIVPCPCNKAFSILSNEEGTCLSGRKLIIQGSILIKIFYTAYIESQSIHSVCCTIPLGSYITLYPKFNNISSLEDDIIVINPENPATTTTIDGFLYKDGQDVTMDLCEDFKVDSFIETASATPLSHYKLLVNSTILFRASPCSKSTSI